MSAASAPDAFVQALLARAPRMHVFQLCRLLEAHAPERPGLGTRDTPEGEPVRLLPHPGMGFPASEIACASGHARVPVARTTFLGLYGVDAAMPPHLIDDIVLRREGHEAVMAFLDQFNHRVSMLMYRAWRKYRYPVGFLRGADDERSRDLLCLAGMGFGDKPRRAGLSPARALAMLGLLNQRTRTAEGIAEVIALAVPQVRVEVEEFFPQWVRVDTPRGLGAKGARWLPDTGAETGLGRGTLLGRRILCRYKAVRVTLVQASGASPDALLPGGEAHRHIMGMLRLYVGVKADVLLRLRVDVAELAPVRLGASRARLGWTSPLKARASRLRTISLGRYEAIAASCHPADTAPLSRGD